MGGVESQPKYHPDSSATCPLVAPDHMLLVANVSVVATGKPVHFHFTQRRVCIALPGAALGGDFRGVPVSTHCVCVCG